MGTDRKISLKVKNVPLILGLDLEVTRSGKRLRHGGAVFEGRTFEWSGGKAGQKALAELDAFGRNARFLLGHNILNHDLPILKSLAPDLDLLKLPVIDTLFLSPLAFPRNPYHRLVKDYKLVRSAYSHPLEDIRLAFAVFDDQWESFLRQAGRTPDMISFYRFCFQNSRFGGFSGDGFARLFELLGADPIEDAGQAATIFSRLTHGRVCRTAVDQAVAAILAADGKAPAAAYGLAWLTVAGSNSVLPPWVRHQFSDVVPFLKNLRDRPCGDHACNYCRRTHDPDSQLRRFFGFDSFRPKPRTADGRSLQRAVVLHGLRDDPLLAVLPTGGGKSLCYQLPALVRHMRRGLLTVVISPLQALMKDQVDNLIQLTGTPFAAAIYGLLTPVERGDVIERVRLGDIAVLYLSPEQLRSASVCAVLAQREIGCWVFDEAHCLSKWGHDFRPDYIYAARFIREFTREQNLPLPPVACFTATAKPDVIEEIREHFFSELGQELALFEGGVERDNLNFDIWPVSAAEKPVRTLEAIREHLKASSEAGIIVYAAKRKTTREISDYLVHNGVPAEAFHAGLEAHDKRRIIENFVAGEIPVICATNAFGMGIDKSNIRLVVHYDIPGSLENYLQEAGRAGRDLEPASCILLYDPQDAETQFRLGAFSEIKKEEIQRILKCLKRGKRNRDGDVVITTQELLRDEEMAGVFEKTDQSRDTRVRTAVSWLERADFLERNQNLTQVFQGRPLVKSVADAEPVIHRLNLSPQMQHLWRGILQVVFNAPSDQGLSADDIAEGLFSSSDQLRRLEKDLGLTPAQLVIHAMHDMATAGLMDKSMMLSAFVRPKGRNSALRLLDTLSDLEIRLLKHLQETAPDAQIGEWLDLDIGRLNQRMQNHGQHSNPVSLRNLIKGLSADGKGLAGSHGSIDLKHVGRNRYRVALQRSWQAVIDTAALRRHVAHVVLRELTTNAEAAAAGQDQAATGELLVAFSANELAAALAHDIILHSNVQKPLAAIDRALMFLHEHKIITLQNGLAVFRQAMTIHLNPMDRRRQYTVGDFKPLAAHYRERRFQVHVIMEYATLALDKLARALGLVLDYFSMDRRGFVEKYFAGRQDILERATSVDSYRRIVESLDNPIQIGIVGAPEAANQLVLAGPGSGKTRVVVHRCAYLLRVERVAASRILVMCFNYHAAIDLRRRLHDLVGPDARGITVATYHGAAMRLAGISLRDLMEHSEQEAIDFDGLIDHAVALLKGEKEIPGLDADDARDQLLQGFSHILVDEYQDIDAGQYELVSAIAGRSLEDGQGRLAIMAVGDDDQNVYAFRGANVAFIRRFQEDYPSNTVFMVENYRSSAHIIQAANLLITRNKDRMKGDHPIRVDRRRRPDPAGGRWEVLDPLGMGRVQHLVVTDPVHQAMAVYQELTRLKTLDPSLRWEQCAVLGRTNQCLAPVRAILEQNAIGVKKSLENGLPLHRIREIRRFLDFLKEQETEIRSVSDLSDALAGDGDNGNPWAALLAELHTAYRQETADAPLPVGYYIDWLYEALAEQRREKTIGRGIFLNTVHGAKGMEFDHVFLLDGKWAMSFNSRTAEEERRLYYVGMTRARQTLCLMEIRGRSNPFINGLGGDCCLRREAPLPRGDEFRAGHRQYSIAGLQEIHLSYAGGFLPGHPIHDRLGRLQPGDKVNLAASGDNIEVHTLQGNCVAKLSRQGVARRRSGLDSIAEVRVLGMLHWSVDDAREAYRGFMKTDGWELPLLEIVTEEKR